MVSSWRMRAVHSQNVRSSILMSKTVASVTDPWYLRVTGADVGLCRHRFLVVDAAPTESCDFTAHLCTGIIHECYKLLVYKITERSRP